MRGSKLNIDPHPYQVLILRTHKCYSTWKRVFADVMKLIKDLEAGKFSWVIQVNSKYSHNCPFKEGLKKSMGKMTKQEGQIGVV